MFKCPYLTESHRRSYSTYCLFVVIRQQGKLGKQKRLAKATHSADGTGNAGLDLLEFGMFGASDRHENMQFSEHGRQLGRRWQAPVRFSSQRLLLERRLGVSGVFEISTRMLHEF